jgi:hypothetical protein
LTGATGELPTGADHRLLASALPSSSSSARRSFLAGGWPLSADAPLARPGKAKAAPAVADLRLVFKNFSAMLGCCCGGGGGEARRREEAGEADSWPHTRMWCAQSFFWHAGEQYGTFLPTSRHFEHILHTQPTDQPANQ